MRAMKPIRVAVIVAICAALGAVGAYVGSATSPSSSSAAAKAAGKSHRFGMHHGRFGGLLGAVHAEAVVPVAGGKFATVTLDRGVVQNVQGSQLTLKEGTAKATYQTLTLDIPSGAIVRIDGKLGKLSDVKAGKHAIVLKGPKNTRVLVGNPPRGPHRGLPGGGPPRGAAMGDGPPGGPPGGGPPPPEQG